MVQPVVARPVGMGVETVREISGVCLKARFSAGEAAPQPAAG